MSTLQETHFDVEAGGDTTVSAGGGGGASTLSSIVSQECTATEIVGVTSEEKGKRDSSVSELSVEDLECGGGDGRREGGNKVHLSKIERDCRICHLSLDLSNQECGINGIAMELGCCCKDDLGAAHKHCAEAWFKIKGNKTCEICGSTACNVIGPNDDELMDTWNTTNDATSSRASVPGGTTTTRPDTRGFWQGHRFLNFLLACMVFAFVISWLFHFNIPS